MNFNQICSPQNKNKNKFRTKDKLKNVKQEKFRKCMK